MPDLSGDEPDFTDETWCLYDGQIIDDELYNLYSTFAEGVRVLVISDSCHSGTVTKAVFYQTLAASRIPGLPALAMSKSDDVKSADFAVKALPPEIALRTYEQNRKFYDDIGKSLEASTDLEKGETIKASVRLISGCQDNQYSYDGTFNSAFTAALLQVWVGGRFKGDYADFHRTIQERLPPYQSPNHFKIGKPDSGYDRQRPFAI